MRHSSAHPAIAAILLASALAGSGPAAGRDTAGRALVLVVRAGELEREELEPRSDGTPGLRWLALHGALLPRISIPGGREAAPTPALLKQAVLPPALLSSIKEQGIFQVVLYTGEEMASAPPAKPGRDAPAAKPAPPPGIIEFRKRFGAPPPAAPEELETIGRLMSILGLEPATGDPAGTIPAALKITSARDAASRDDPASRALEALQKGARLVVLLDPVRATGEDNAVRRRDALLEALREVVLERDGAHLGVLSLSLKDASPNAVFVIHGPAVRSGWVVPAGVPAPALGAGLLRILGCRPPELPESEDALGEILRE